MSDQRAFVRRLRKNLTDTERALWQRLRQRQIGGHKFRRQHAVAGYILDFACVEWKLAVEVDGGHHAELTGYDRERTRVLEAHGYRVLRFWNNEVSGNMAGVLAVILSALEEKPPSRPSPCEGEGERSTKAEV